MIRIGEEARMVTANVELSRRLDMRVPVDCCFDYCSI